MNLLNLLFPKKCLNCGRVGDYLCSSCLQLIPWHTEAKCLVCEKRAIGGYSHPGCLGAWGLDRAILLAYYRGPIRKVVQGLKYKKLADEQYFITNLIASRLDKDDLKDFVVTSVPLHFTREFSRGFNQSKLLADGLASRIILVYKDNLIYRSSVIISQVELDKNDRARNVRGAFKVYDKKQVLGAKILLIDDVITTGATVSECAKVLKRNGAKEVWALALAHG